MKVWTANKITDIAGLNKQFLKGEISRHYQPESDFRVAIVGGGPKGAYAIERLASVWNSQNSDKELDIICFNSSMDFSSGPNYQTDQADFLLMNYNLGKVNFWTEENDQLVEDRPSLLEFLTRFKVDPEIEVFSADYTSRAVTGIYLQYCLRSVLESLPSNIRVHLIVDEVISIVEDSEFIAIQTKDGLRSSFSEVICCTGHSYSFGSSRTQIHSRNKSKDFTTEVVQSVYPVRKLQSMNFSGLTVAIKGMGLTFMDAILAITEGNGGNFKRSKERMTYTVSGRGPHEILAFSRTGLPMIARQKDLRTSDFSLRFFTEETVEHLLDKYNKLDLKLHLMPFIQREFRYQYVVHLLRAHSDKNIPPDLTLKELELYAAEIFPDFKSFDLEEFLAPKLSKSELHSAVFGYLEETVFPERFDEIHQSRVAMSALWREIYPLFNKIYSFGKLSGESQQQFDLEYFGKFQRVAYGPPKENMEKIYALAEAGILKFDLAHDPRVSIHHQLSYLKLSNEDIPHSKIASVLIDARIPKPNGLNSQPEYVQKLVSGMGINFFSNDDYKTGSLQIDQIGRLKKKKQICFYGTPTEGWTLDNESLSRSNNNFLSPWVYNLVKNHVNNKNPKINAYYPFLG